MWDLSPGLDADTHAYLVISVDAIPDVGDPCCHARWSKGSVSSERERAGNKAAPGWDSAKHPRPEKQFELNESLVNKDNNFNTFNLQIFFMLKNPKTLGHLFKHTMS